MKGTNTIMKNQRINILIVMLCMVCMAGCRADHSEEQSSAEVMMEFAGSKKHSEDVGQTEEMTAPEQQLGETVQGLDPALFDGRSMDIWKGKGNTLLVLKEDTLYLYDVVSAQIKAETKTENWDMVTFYPYEGGYCAIGEFRKGEPVENTEGEMMMVEVDDDDIECLGIFYDDSLKKTREISLDDIVSGAAWGVWTVSSDGAMLGYYDQWDGLNLYDPERQKKQKLLDMGQDGNSAGLLSIDKLFFDEENRHVVYTGQTNQNGRSVASWGRIGIDGTEFENHVQEYELGGAAGYGDGKLLLGEDSLFFKKRMGVINTKTGEAAYQANTERELPVSGPFFSDDGKVYATAALGTNQMEIAVWRTGDFALLHKETIRDDREEMFYRSPQICLFPDLQICIVCMGGHNDIPQRAVLLNYQAD